MNEPTTTPPPEESSAPLPRYRCHKEVNALKLLAVRIIKPTRGRSHVELIPEDPSFRPIIVDHAWRRRHKPQPGGYWVQYDDGYTSYSPAAPFESGYTLIEP